MKKLITILILFIGFIASAQVVVPRGSKSVAVQDAYLYSTFGLKVPLYGDTTAANLMMGHDSLGLMIETISPAGIYYRAVSTGSIHKWTILASTPASAIWGLIMGTLSSQTDLQAALNAKQNLIFLGSTAQYFRGDLSLATFPTDLASFTNGPGYLTAVNSTMSITGVGSVATPLKFLNDVTSPGANQFYGTDNGGVKHWLPNTDTTTVTPIGTGSPQIQTLWASGDGNLRTARLVPGTFMVPFQNGDSAYGVNADTASLATWNGITSRGGFTNIYNTNGTLTGDRYLSGPLSAGVPTKTLYFDSLFQFYINASGLGNGVDIYGLANTSHLQVGSNEITETAFNVATDKVSYNDLQGDSSRFSVYTSGDTARITLSPNYMNFYQFNGVYRFRNLSQANDTTTYKPLAANSAGTMKRMDGWAGSGGGGSTNGVGRDTVQAYTSGATLTQSASTNYIQVNPASVQAALTITSLASGGTWHTSNDIYIVFGGTVTSGNPVITSFTFTAGSGLTIVETSAFTGTINAGDVAHYHKIGTILYRVP